MPRVKVERLMAMLDVKDWMSDHVSDLTGHIYQHQFKIDCNAEVGFLSIDV